MSTGSPGSSGGTRHLGNVLSGLAVALGSVLFLGGFVWGATRALRMDPMVIHDSTISIARGFRRADWTRLIAIAGTPARVRWAFPFRWIVSRAR